MISAEKITRLTKGQQKALHNAVGRSAAEHLQELIENGVADADLLRQYVQDTEPLRDPMKRPTLSEGLNDKLLSLLQAAESHKDCENGYALAKALLKDFTLRYQQMKNINGSLQLMAALQKNNVTIAEFNKIPTADAEIFQEDDALFVAYSLPLTGESWTLIQELEALHLEIGGHTYLAEAGGFHIESPREIKNDGGRFLGRIRISHLHNVELCKKKCGYVRYMIPVKEIDWNRDIQTYSAFIRNGWMLGLLELWHEDTQIHVYGCKHEGQNFMVIESLSATTLEAMTEYVYSVALTLGFITGRIHLGKSYVFCGDTPEFDEHLLMEYLTMRPSSDSDIRIFTTNMYSVNEALKQNKVAITDRFPLYDAKGEFQPHLQDWLHQDFIQRLFVLIQTDAHIARAVVTLIESANFPLEYQAGVRAIVLETIAHSVPGPKPIEDDALWEAMKADISAVITKHTTTADGTLTIPEASRGILDKKLNSINNPTNADSLAKPFEGTGYVLTNEDRNALKKRDTYLHGSLAKGSVEKQTNEVFYISLMLHKLCSIIILKRAGFAGYILNNPVLYNCKKAVDAGERPLLLI